MLFINLVFVFFQIMASNYDSIGSRVLRNFKHVIDGHKHDWLKGNYRDPLPSILPLPPPCPDQNLSNINHNIKCIMPSNTVNEQSINDNQNNQDNQCSTNGNELVSKELDTTECKPVSKKRRKNSADLIDENNLKPLLCEVKNKIQQTEKNISNKVNLPSHQKDTNDDVDYMNMQEALSDCKEIKDNNDDIIHISIDTDEVDGQQISTLVPSTRWSTIGRIDQSTRSDIITLTVQDLEENNETQS